MIKFLRTLTVLLGAFACFAAFGADAIKSLNGPLVSPEPTGDFVFAVAGDNRPTAQHAPPPRVVQTIFSEMRLIRPDLVLWTGDTIFGYGDTKDELVAEYDSFVARAAHAAVPIFNAPGNHEIHAFKPCNDPVPEEKFKDRFGALWGSFNYRGAHFIALDTEQCGHVSPSDPKVQVIDGEQLDWLKNDLEANKNARAIFIFFHTEMYGAPNDEEAASHKPLGNAAQLNELFLQYPVKAVFQGHEHLFFKTPPDSKIQYFVAGGAGAPMYARPENGGFSHYLVVTMKADQLAYTVVEPGHLYAEEGKAAKSEESMVWLVNSSDTPLPVRRLETSVPLSLGTCAELTAESRLTSRKGPVSVPLKITGCATDGKKHKLTITLDDVVPSRSSVPIYVLRRAAAK